ncbi:MAG TPA: hypothetical protein VIJ62_08545 [Rhizomicrobium sp.]
MFANEMCNGTIYRNPANIADFQTQRGAQTSGKPGELLAWALRRF